MAELTSKDRLQPSLLDRLRDDEPLNPEESADRRVLSHGQLRDSVKRDLACLLNATHLAAVQDLHDFPDVERSTINYGIPDLAGRPASTIETGALARLIKRAITLFEPRLLGPSLKVQVTVNPDGHDPNALRFDIESELWAQPLAVRLRLRAELDLEDGETSVFETAVSG